MDSRKCQTATASPADPGELPVGLEARFIAPRRGYEQFAILPLSPRQGLLGGCNILLLVSRQQGIAYEHKFIFGTVKRLGKRDDKACGGKPMNLSAISATSVSNDQPELRGPAPAPATSQASSLPEPSDTVSLSSAAQKASSSGDVDHEGDSH
jgi:hypothetical protein